jgi:hypothetical protein
MTSGRARILMATTVFLLLGASTTLATPPDRIRLGFDYASDVLTIKVHHPTFYVAAHHVAKIAVMLNDSLVVVQQFGGQTDKQEQDTQCVVPGVEPGDKLTVTAVCSVYGKRTETLLLPNRNR